MNNDLGRRRLSSNWKYEKDFSEWLSNNIHYVGDIIGKKIVSSDTEVKVSEEYGKGKYPADILAITNDNEKIVIENQYSVTDHIHLGELITYAFWLGATTIVWIAEKVDKEHLIAMQQLNERSDLNCYLLIAQLKPEFTLKKADMNDVIDKKSEYFIPSNSELYTDFWDRFEEKYSMKEGEKLFRANRTDCINISFGKPYYFNIPFRRTNLKIEVHFKKYGNIYYNEIKKDEIKIKDELSIYLGEYIKLTIIEPSPKSGISQIKIERPAQVKNVNMWDEYIDWIIAVVSKIRDIVDRYQNIY